MVTTFPTGHKRLSRFRMFGLGIGVFVTVSLSVIGCAGQQEPFEGASSSPGPEATLPAPTTSVSANAVPSRPDSPAVLPTCSTLFTPVGLALLSANGLVSAPVDPAPGGLGDFERISPRLRTIATSAESLTCSFILPASERGLVISVARVSDADRLAITSVLATAGYLPISTASLGPASSGFANTVSGEYPYTEAHVVVGDLWVSCFDYFGQSAVGYATDATRSTLN